MERLCQAVNTRNVMESQNSWPRPPAVPRAGSLRRLGAFKRCGVMNTEQISWSRSLGTRVRPRVGNTWPAFTHRLTDDCAVNAWGRADGPAHAQCRRASGPPAFRCSAVAAAMTFKNFAQFTQNAATHPANLREFPTTWRAEMLVEPPKSVRRSSRAKFRRISVAENVRDSPKHYRGIEIGRRSPGCGADGPGRGGPIPG